MQDNVAEASLDWAYIHMRRFGDTDIFPVPFELEALSFTWDSVRRELSQKDLNVHSLGSSRRTLVPKPSGGFRVATQLDPIDSLLYAAMLYEHLPKVEGARVPIDRRIACSYRLDVQPDGPYSDPIMVGVTFKTTHMNSARYMTTRMSSWPT
jgi:hypothetical protein